MAAEFVYGMHAVKQLITSDPLGLLSLWLDRERNDATLRELRELAKAQGIAIQPATRASLDNMTNNALHQGVVAKYRRSKMFSPPMLEDLLADKARSCLLLMLDGVQDPHNLGACLRSADASATDAVVVPRSRGVGLTGTVRKVASGAAETVPLIEVANLARAIVEVQSAGVRVLGCDEHARRSIYDVDLREPTAFVLGGEGQGLRRLTRERCDELVRIPMQGRVESLNVSVAAALCLFETVRQRSLCN